MLSLITPPEEYPLTTDETKNALRVEIEEDDLLIERLIRSATEQAEQVTQRALVTQEWELRLDSFPAERFIEIPKPPLQSVIEVTYLDASGNEQTLSESVYRVSAPKGPFAMPGKVVLVGSAQWPATNGDPESVVIRFVCGYGDAEESAELVPDGIKDAMLAYIAERYENREESAPNSSVATLPNTMKSVLWPWAVEKFGI